jgi:hypothetical protein
MGICLERKFRPAIGAAELDFDHVRPTCVILNFLKLGERRELDDFPVVHERAQPPHEFGQFPGGCELAFHVQGRAILTGHRFFSFSASFSGEIIFRQGQFRPVVCWSPGVVWAYGFWT